MARAACCGHRRGDAVGRLDGPGGSRRGRPGGRRTPPRRRVETQAAAAFVPRWPPRPRPQHRDRRPPVPPRVLSATAGLNRPHGPLPDEKVGAMRQRTLAGVVAGPLVVVLLVIAAFAPLPYVIYRPGDTINVLGDEFGGKEIIQVEGHKTYRDGGELRMTTVIVRPPEAGEQPARADGHLARRQRGDALRRGLPRGRDRQRRTTSRARCRWSPRRTRRSRWR